jgi:hypothetical protein
MVDINLPNAITVGLIAVLVLVAVRMVFKMRGAQSPV